MKKVLSLFAVFSIILIHTQKLGINQPNPRVSLDIKDDDMSKLHARGFLPPQISRNNLVSISSQYGAEQDGTIIYINNIEGSVNAGTPESGIYKEGYYIFSYNANGSAWKKLVLEKGDKIEAKIVTNESSTISNNSSVDFTNSNLAKINDTSANRITLNGIKDGGAYTLVIPAGGAGNITFVSGNFNFKSMGVIPRIRNKAHIYSFIVIENDVYVTMAVEN